MPHITFLTGTRAEFGLMLPTLQAIKRHPKLHLSILATGMHLDPTHGHSLNEIRRHFKINATIPWPPTPKLGTRNSELVTSHLATTTGAAITQVARALDKLKTDILLVVGDRVEAFAGASAAHLSHRLLAHVHGGDRAQGQLDDSLRHTITKLAHIHFPATKDSAQRLLKLGEHPKSIHLVGSPGLDNLKSLATPTRDLQRKYNLRPGNYALLLLHPASPDESLEHDRAQSILTTTAKVFDRILVIYPNNDPGSAGILRAWQSLSSSPSSILHPPSSLSFHPDLPRPDFLGLMRDAAILIGNSSSGIIEAASFSTPVLDIGPRQLGRLTSGNVTHTDYKPSSILRHLRNLPPRFQGKNLYGDGRAAPRIARTLASITPQTHPRFKLITY